MLSIETLRVVSPVILGDTHSIKESIFLIEAATILSSVFELNLQNIPPKFVDRLVPVMRIRVPPPSDPALGQNSVMVGF